MMHKRHHALKSADRCGLVQELCFQGYGFRDLAQLILQYEEPGVYLVQVQVAEPPNQKEKKETMMTYKWLDLRGLVEQAEVALDCGLCSTAAVFRAKSVAQKKAVSSSNGPVWSPQTADGQAVVLTGPPVGWYYWTLSHVGLLGFASQQLPGCAVLKPLATTEVTHWCTTCCPASLAKLNILGVTFLAVPAGDL